MLLFDLAGHSQVISCGRRPVLPLSVLDRGVPGRETLNLVQDGSVSKLLDLVV